MQIWVTKYVGFPDSIACDQGSIFISAKLGDLCRASGVSLRISGVESHNALGEGERYHAFLRRVYTKVKLESPDLAPDPVLAVAVKAVNETAGPSGFVPTLLVFGVSPHLPFEPRALPGQAMRMRVMYAARKEMGRLTAQERVSAALLRNAPAASGTTIAVGDEVLWYREKPTVKWTGPFTVTDRRGKLLRLDDGDREVSTSVDKVKLFTEKEPPPDSPHEQVIAHPGSTRVENRVTEAATEVDAILSGASGGSGNAYGSPMDASGLRRLDEILGNPRVDTPEDAIPIDEFVVKILPGDDARVSEPDFVKAKRKETVGLMGRKIWRIVKRGTIGPDANVMGGRFIYTLKNYGTPSEQAKERYVAQGFDDKEKPYIVHDTSTLRASSIRAILSVAGVSGFRIYSHDVTQAYLQSKYKMTRDVYIQPN